MNRRKGNNSLQLSGSFLFSSNYARPQQHEQTQYRATQMWHKSLETFLAGVPLGQHRSRTRFWNVFESTFTGTEAISWFHEQLKQSFDQEISREQTKKLLGKFYRAGVFCNVEIEPSVSEQGHFLDENDFKDSQMHIYRLAMDRPPATTAVKTPSPVGKNKSTLAKIKKNYSIEIKPLSLEEKEKIYFDLFLEWLGVLTLSSSLSTIQPTANVYNNILPLVAAGNSQQSTTSSSSSAQLFPNWILPAMKYLALYPEESQLHVDYPNFEHDVFVLVFDYFFSFYDRVGKFIPDAGLFLNVLSNVQPVLPQSKFQEKFPFPKSEFEEIEKIFTPKSKAAAASTSSKRFIMGKNRRRIFDDSALSLGGDESSISVKPMGIVDTSRYHHRSSIYLATSFDVRSPVTRVLSQSEIYAYENPCLNLSPADLINHPKYGGLRGRLKGGRKSLSVGDLAESSDDDGGFAPSSMESVVQPETKRPAIEALTLLLLTLDPNKRKHLEILLKFMGKVEKNLKLCLDVAVTNKDMLFDFFARLILDNPEEPNERDLISFMIANVDNLFGGEYLEGFKKSAEDIISERQIKKIPITRLNSKENLLATSFCSKISMIEYEDQRLLGETSKSLRNLLDEMALLKDEKLRKKQLKKFQKEYPHIYAEKFNNSSSLENSTSSSSASPFQQQQKSKKRTPFGVLI